MHRPMIGAWAGRYSEGEAGSLSERWFYRVTGPNLKKADLALRCGFPSSLRQTARSPGQTAPQLAGRVEVRCDDVNGGGECLQSWDVAVEESEGADALLKAKEACDEFLCAVNLFPYMPLDGLYGGEPCELVQVARDFCQFSKFTVLAGLRCDRLEDRR